MAEQKDPSSDVTTTINPDDFSDSESGHGGPWITFLTAAHWYPKDMPLLEKKLVLKLDLLILIFGCLSFFTKYLDQQAITNAYVSYVGTFSFSNLQH